MQHDFKMSNSECRREMGGKFKSYFLSFMSDRFVFWITFNYMPLALTNTVGKANADNTIPAVKNAHASTNVDSPYVSADLRLIRVGIGANI